MDKHDEVIDELLKNPELVESLGNLLRENLAFMHLGLGMFIRNKYLWTSKTNAKYFMKYYHKDNLDEVSDCILRDLISIIVKRY